MKLIIRVVLILLVLGLLAFFTVIPTYLGKQMNAVINQPPYAASDRA